MSNATQGERPTLTSPAGVWLGRAWIAVALIPVFFIFAFAVGQVLYSLMGYLPENAGIPLWVDLVDLVTPFRCRRRDDGPQKGRSRRNEGVSGASACAGSPMLSWCCDDATLEPTRTGNDYRIMF